MKQLLTILAFSILILAGCTTPNYGGEETKDFVYEVAEGKEVISFNGHVLEVTENNTLRVKVPKRGDLTEKGLNVNEEGIIEVALASVSIPDDVPFAEEANKILKEQLLGQDITVEVPELDTSNDLTQIFGYISVEKEDVEYLIQDVLLEDGLAILDQTTPYLSEYIDDFKSIIEAQTSEKQE